MTNVQMNAAAAANEEVTTDEATTEAAAIAYVPTEAPSVTAFADAMAELINRALALPDGGIKKQTNFRNGLPIPVLGGMVASGQSYKKTHLIVMTLQDGTEYTFDVRRSRTAAEAAFAIEAAERQMRQDDGAPSMEGDDLPSAALAVQAIVEREGITLAPEIAASVAAIAETNDDTATSDEAEVVADDDDFLSQQTGIYSAARRIAAEDAEDAAAEFAAEQAAESATFLHGGPIEADEQDDDEESDEDSDRDDESDNEDEDDDQLDRDSDEREFADREEDDESITPDDEQEYEPYHED